MAHQDADTGLVEAMRRAALEAGDLALRYFREDAETTASIQYKDGGSPVSEADFAVDRLLRERLSRLVPEAGWLSEETADTAGRLEKHRVFIVDPIDGTRAFIKGDGRWGISLALVEAGRPALAVLHMPALRETYTAIAGRGAAMNGAKIAVSTHPQLKGARFAGPVKAMDGLDRQGYGLAREPRVPSLAYRLARIASGDLDAAVASTSAWDWDIAAADLLICEAGGRLTDIEMNAPIYNAAEPRHKALAAAARHLHDELLAAIRKVAADG